MKGIFEQEGLKLKVFTKEEHEFAHSVCLTEYIQGITTWDLYEKLCEDKDNIWDLRIFFERYYGKDIDQALNNFVESFAAFQVQFYLLKVYSVSISNSVFFRDGSFMNINRELYFTHWMESNSTVLVIRKRNAPFWLPKDILDLLGGTQSKEFAYMKELIAQGLMAVDKHLETIVSYLKVYIEKENLLWHEWNSDTLLKDIRERLEYDYGIPCETPD